MPTFRTINKTIEAIQYTGANGKDVADFLQASHDYTISDGCATFMVKGTASLRVFKHEYVIDHSGVVSKMDKIGFEQKYEPSKRGRAQSIDECAKLLALIEGWAHGGDEIATDYMQTLKKDMAKCLPVADLDKVYSDRLKEENKQKTMDELSEQHEKMREDRMAINDNVFHVTKSDAEFFDRKKKEQEESIAVSDLKNMKYSDKTQHPFGLIVQYFRRKSTDNFPAIKFSRDNIQEVAALIGGYYDSVVDEVYLFRRGPSVLTKVRVMLGQYVLKRDNVEVWNADEFEKTFEPAVPCLLPEPTPEPVTHPSHVVEMECVAVMLDKEVMEHFSRDIRSGKVKPEKDCEIVTCRDYKNVFMSLGVPHSELTLYTKEEDFRLEDKVDVQIIRK